MFGGRMTKRLALGIDIGPGVIKAVTIAEDDSSWIVNHVLRAPTPAGAVDRGIVVKPAEVSHVLKGMIRSIGGSIKSAAAAIPADQSIVRWLELPRMDAESLRAATPFEARKHLSYPVEQAEVEIVPEMQGDEDDSPTMKALLVAAPKEIVHSRAAAIEQAGLDVDCMELEAFALMRALYTPNLRRVMLWSSHSRAYLQLGEDSSCMYVLQDGKLRFVRAIAWGSARLTQVLSQTLECTEEEARRIKEDERSTVNESGELVYREGASIQTTDALAVEFDRLSREIQRLMSYYQSLFPEGSYEGILNQITLCGGAAGLKGMAHYLGNRLEIEFDTGDPFQLRALRLAPGVSDAIYGYRSSFSVAIGLALGQMQSAMQSTETGDIEYIWRRCA
jgi:type IV pilus assembly protein PilM